VPCRLATEYQGPAWRRLSSSTPHGSSPESSPRAYVDVKAEEEAAACTFRPAINSKSRSMMKARGRDSEPGSAAVAEAHLKLYEVLLGCPVPCWWPNLWVLDLVEVHTGHYGAMPCNSPSHALQCLHRPFYVRLELFAWAARPHMHVVRVFLGPPPTRRSPLCDVRDRTPPGGSRSSSSTST
jgi:hypothetical protein